MNIAEYVLSVNESDSDMITEMYWPIILNDLNFVGQYWNTSSYDLWEEKFLTNRDRNHFQDLMQADVLLLAHEG